MVCLRCFILFSILFQCNTPLVLTSPSLLPIATGRRSANGLFESFILFSLLFLTQCALDPHQFPSSSSSVAIRRQNTPPDAGGGGGEGGGGRVGGVRPRCRSAARGGGAPRRDDAPGRPFVFVVQFEILIRFHSSFCVGPSPPRSSPRSSPRTSPRFSLRPHLRTSSQTSLLRYFDASLLRCFFVWCSHDENKKKIF